MYTQIIFLCILSIVLSLLSWGYLAYYESAEEAEQRNFKFKYLIEKKAKTIYSAIMLVLLCGISLALNLVYVENTMINNSKLIVLLAILFVVAFVDYKKFIIPNQVILFGLLIRFGFYVAEFFMNNEQFWDVLKNDLIALAIVVIFFIVGVFIVKNGLGMGDIKLMIIMCLYQGFNGVISSLFFSLCVAFVLSVGLLICRKKTKKDSIAFAPSILCGTIISVFLTGM